jgi:hypothetical protein
MKPQYIEINEDGDKYYYSDKEMIILHREDGAAIEWNNGNAELDDLIADAKKKKKYGF